MQGKLQKYLKKKIPKNTYQLLHLIDKHSNQEETYLAKNTQKKHPVIITVNLKAKLKTLGFVDPSDDLSLRQQVRLLNQINSKFLVKIEHFIEDENYVIFFLE